MDSCIGGEHMSKIIYKQKRKETSKIRALFEFYYNQKFFNAWMNKLEFSGLNYQQKEFIMKKYWCDGTIACLQPIGIPSELLPQMGEDQIIFTPWTTNGVYNIYDYPTKALAINTRGVSFIPNYALELDKEIVVGYCQRNKKSVYSSIECKIKELVDIEMTLRINMKSQKFPFVFATTPENKQAIEDLVDGIESDDPILLTTLEEVEKAKALNSGATYIIDKLEMQRQKIEDDINTILGLSNVGIMEKKEHLLTGEIEANNESIDNSNDDFLACIKEFFERVKTAFGYNISVKLAHQKEEKEEPMEVFEDVEQDN